MKNHNDSFYKDIKRINSNNNDIELNCINFFKYKKIFLINSFKVIDLDFSYIKNPIDKEKILNIRHGNQNWKKFYSEFSSKILHKDLVELMSYSTRKAYEQIIKVEENEENKEILNYLKYIYSKYIIEYNKLFNNYIESCYLFVTYNYKEEMFLSFDEFMQDVNYYLIDIIHRYNKYKCSNMKNYFHKRIMFYIKKIIFDYSLVVRINSGSFYKIVKIMEDCSKNNRTHEYLCKRYNITERVLMSYFETYNKYIKNCQNEYLDIYDIEDEFIYNDDKKNKIDENFIEERQTLFLEFINNLGLSKKNIEIIKMRYGFGDDGIEHGLREIGNKFGLTRQRVQQIDALFIAKIKQKQTTKDKFEKCLFPIN